MTYNKMLEWCERDQDKDDFFKVEEILNHQKNKESTRGYDVLLPSTPPIYSTGRSSTIQMKKESRSGQRLKTSLPPTSGPQTGKSSYFASDAKSARIPSRKS